MATFYLVRHGQTEWNLAGKMQGRFDSPLTDLGKEQAKKSAEELKTVKFNYCYYSPVGRTKATAAILLQHHNLTPNEYEHLYELNLGEWEGCKHSKEKNTDNEYHNFWYDPVNFKGAPGGGESYYDVQDRVYDGVKKLVDMHADEDIVLLVSHCAAIRSFLNKCIDRKMEDFWALPKTEPASISIVRWNKGKEPEVIMYSGHEMSEVQ